MSTLRRILKYMPAVVLGLLLVAWVVSVPLTVGYAFVDRSLGESNVELSGGCFVYEWFGEALGISIAGFYWYRDGTEAREFIGWFEFSGVRVGEPRHDWRRICLPLVGIALPLVPVAIGPFISFRFRLWHYLAYTALVAVELAYYLRWQGH